MELCQPLSCLILTLTDSHRGQILLPGFLLVVELPLLRGCDTRRSEQVRTVLVRARWGPAARLVGAHESQTTRLVLQARFGGSGCASPSSAAGCSRTRRGVSAKAACDSPAGIGALQYRMDLLAGYKSFGHGDNFPYVEYEGRTTFREFGDGSVLALDTDTGQWMAPSQWDVRHSVRTTSNSATGVWRLLTSI